MNKWLLAGILQLIFITNPNFVNAAHKIKWNTGWLFVLDSAKSPDVLSKQQQLWRRLNLPHDWAIEGSFSDKHPAGVGGGALPGGVGWYQKSFVLPIAEKQQKMAVEFEGVYCNSEVWINGHYLGKRPNGYISFSYDITPYLHYGAESNTIEVRVDNSRQPNSRWYSGAGIYRNVWLVKNNAVHIAPWGIFASTPQVNAKEATVQVETKICSDGKAIAQMELSNLLYDATGKLIATKKKRQTVQAHDTVDISQQLLVNSPMLWSVDKPTLYKLITQVKIAGRLVDEQSTNIGIRYFSFDENKGFSLNGKPLKILGVCNHHDQGCLGAAFNLRAAERQLEILKAMGCNGIRTSHNPPAPGLLDLCDKMGFIVMDEAFDMWQQEKNPYDYHLDWQQWHAIDLQAQIRRDCNHPSVFIWSVGNEIPEQWGNASKGDSAGRNISRELVQLVKQLDTSRPIVTANNEPKNYNNLMQSGAFDLIGYNYHHQNWEDFQKDWPGKQFIITESTSALETRGHYDLVPMDTIRRWPPTWDKNMNEDGNKDFSVSAYDHVSTPWGTTHEESWRLLKKHPHISGMYVWTGFDYLGEPTPYVWPARSSYFGIIDLAGFPKDVYYMYQSEWTNKSMLHLYPHWNWQQGDTVDMVAYYNNADEVELFLNGQSLGSKHKTTDSFHVKWRIPFEPGTVKAVSKKAGKTVLVKEVHTAGKPARIMLQADRNNIKADGEDLSFITASIVDDKGVVVPNASHLIQFSVVGAGALVGVDNGDPTSHESFKGNTHKAMAGLCLAVVQSKNVKGRVEVKATANGLLPGSLTLKID